MSITPIKAFAEWAAAHPGATIEQLAVAFPKHGQSTINAQFRRTGLLVGDPTRAARAKRGMALGVIGEAHAVAMLEAQGWTVDHVNGRKHNVAVIDLIAHKDGRTIEVQVKASRKYGVNLTQKNALPHIWFIVVDYRSSEPRTYVLPGTALVMPVYYRSPCGIAGQIRMNALAAYENNEISIT
ncbi:hypothetical protein MESS2_190027 [Mesorhizobium metallidurans STM 2683]|uniref:PD(D/E)XK endonuclease domain-containing protein n=1 Tax=Mesorhizobium metallidurans STM 2683 TaxID=1297569 RepID=M5EPB4_9HYPH|nr:hypothetical protein [Mesorhizobium metallidurans]CCV05958.1 hypothetical protein MESS2_190027 [Mesorhizobium metallidurans STM 2683]